MQSAVTQLSHVSRQAIVLLLIRVIVLEVFLEIVAFIPRIFVTFFFSQLLVATSVKVGIEVYFGLLTLIQLILLVHLFLKWESSYYEIHQKEIDKWQGILHKKKETFSFVHAESISVYQDFMGRIFHYGTVQIYAPTLKQHIELVNIPNPHAIADFLKHELPQKDASLLFRR